MEKCKSTNEDVDANANEYDEDLEEEEEEDEEEEEEEEVEEEELDMAAGENEMSFDSHGCILQNHIGTENSSRTYLQGLFDSFPTSEPGFYGDVTVDDGSDGEFQIYEPESEGMYSIDDDDDDDNDDEEEDDDDE